MATFIETDGARVTGATTPTTAGTIIRDAQYGIDSTINGYIIQSISLAHEAIKDTTQDQKNATVSELDLDHHYTATLEVIGGSSEDGSLSATGGNIEVGDTSFSFAGKTWKVTGVNFNGSYQDKKKYSVTLERWTNFPSAT